LLINLIGGLGIVELLTSRKTWVSNANIKFRLSARQAKHHIKIRCKTAGALSARAEKREYGLFPVRTENIRRKANTKVGNNFQMGKPRLGFYFTSIYKCNQKSGYGTTHINLPRFSPNPPFLFGYFRSRSQKIHFDLQIVRIRPNRQIIVGKNTRPCFSAPKNIAPTRQKQHFNKTYKGLTRFSLQMILYALTFAQLFETK